jgi:hypothetical protein
MGSVGCTVLGHVCTVLGVLWGRVGRVALDTGTSRQHLAFEGIAACGVQGVCGAGHVCLTQGCSSQCTDGNVAWPALPCDWLPVKCVAWSLVWPCVLA